MLIDTHAHLTMPQFADLPEVLKRAKDAGIGCIINASFDLDSSRKAVELAAKHENIYAAVGIHPHHADSVDEKALEELRKLARLKQDLYQMIKFWVSISKRFLTLTHILLLRPIQLMNS